MYWQTSRRRIPLDKPLVMGVLNATPDSFSDGDGAAPNVDDALHRAEQLALDGASLIDIGGESTRPGSSRVAVAIELERVIPIIEAISTRIDIPVSIDTSHSEVAKAALAAGAEIVNDISGLRWEPEIARIAAEAGAGIVLMHSRGTFEEMHAQEPVEDVVSEVIAGLRVSLAAALGAGVAKEAIVLDVGLGFGKTADQNLDLIANLGNIVREFKDLGIVVGASRKSFIGRAVNEPEPRERVTGSVVAAVIAVRNGAKIVRAHDVRETVAGLKMLERLESST